MTPSYEPKDVKYVYRLVVDKGYVVKPYPMRSLERARERRDDYLSEAKFDAWIERTPAENWERIE